MEGWSFPPSGVWDALKKTGLFGSHSKSAFAEFDISSVPPEILASVQEILLSEKAYVLDNPKTTDRSLAREQVNKVMPPDLIDWLNDVTKTQSSVGLVAAKQDSGPGASTTAALDEVMQNVGTLSKPPPIVQAVLKCVAMLLLPQTAQDATEWKAGHSRHLVCGTR